MCSRMEAKLMNSSEESSIGSAVYFSSKVFTENLLRKKTPWQFRTLLDESIFMSYDQHRCVCVTTAAWWTRNKTLEYVRPEVDRFPITARVDDHTFLLVKEQHIVQFIHWQ